MNRNAVLFILKIPTEFEQINGAEFLENYLFFSILFTSTSFFTHTSSQ